MSINSRSLEAFGLAFVLEISFLAVIIVAGAIFIKPPVAKSGPIILVEAEILPQEPKPEVKQPHQVKPLPKTQAKPAPKPVQPLPKLEPQTIAPTPTVESPQVMTQVVDTPIASTEPVAHLVSVVAPAPTSKGNPNAEYAAKVRAAVQAAVYYPPAAVALRFTGRVRLEFHLRDSVPGEPHVVVSSKVGIIDNAALQAVQNATYPLPPTDMAGSDQLYQIWVEFTRKS